MIQPYNVHLIICCMNWYDGVDWCCFELIKYDYRIDYSNIIINSLTSVTLVNMDISI